jgi:hypothetical protein
MEKKPSFQKMVLGEPESRRQGNKLCPYLTPANIKILHWETSLKIEFGINNERQDYKAGTMWGALVGGGE